jgi:hypothetical protein
MFLASFLLHRIFQHLAIMKEESKDKEEADGANTQINQPNNAAGRA